MRLELFEKQTGLSAGKPALELTVSSVDDLPYHWHEDLEIMMVLKGSIMFYASTLKKRLTAGDVELISVDEIHRIKGEEGNIILSLKLRTPLAEQYIPEVRDVVFDCNLHPGREVGKGIQQRFCGLFSSFFLHVYHKGDKILDEPTRERLAEILHFVMDQFDIVSKVLNRKELSAAEREVQQSRYRRVADFIFKNSSRRIGLRDIAERENLSLSFLSHAIKDLFGNGFQELINYQRVCTAMKLLLSTDFNITDIAFECGFSAPRYLQNRFEEFLEMKPAAFRKRYPGGGKIPEVLIHDVDSLSTLALLRAYSSEPGTEEAEERRLILDFRATALCVADWRMREPEAGGAEAGPPSPFEDKREDHREDDWARALAVLKGVMDQPPGPEGLSGTLGGPSLPTGARGTALSAVLSALTGLGPELLSADPAALVCRGGGLHILLLNDAGIDTPEGERSFVLEFSNPPPSCRVVRKRFTEENSSPRSLLRSLGRLDAADREASELIKDFLCPETGHQILTRPEELRVVLPPRSFELIRIVPVV